MNAVTCADAKRLAALAECERAMRDAGEECLKCWIAGCRVVPSSGGIAYFCPHACHTQSGWASGLGADDHARRELLFLPGRWVRYADYQGENPK